MRGWLIAALLVAVLVAIAGCTASPELAAAPSGDASAEAPATVTPLTPTPVRPPAELTVFTAASLIEAFTELGQQFEAANPGVRVTFNFAGSQQLAQQLAQGAPADVFASANQSQMQAAVEAGRVEAGRERTFARNRLVVIFPRDNPAALASLQNLANPGLRLVLAAEAVPVGQYSLEFLSRASADDALGAAFREAVLANVVSYEENVRAVLSKVALGEADAGIVYTSDVSQATEVGQLSIPDKLNPIAHYPIAPMLDSEQPDLAHTFVDFVLSATGQDVLARYGFIPVIE